MSDQDIDPVDREITKLVDANVVLRRERDELRARVAELEAANEALREGLAAIGVTAIDELHRLMDLKKREGERCK